MNLLEQEALKFANSFDYDKCGLIVSPGKFEGEPKYTPYFWDMVLHGGSDDTIGPIERWTYDIFEITEQDQENFPDLNDVKIVSITSDEYGFVYSDLDPNFEDILE